MKNIIVTTSWDDGHKLDLKIEKLLKKYDLSGTFYISPKNREFDKKYLLTNHQIVNIGNNFEIGAHTMTHPLLAGDIKTFIFKILVKLLKTLEGKDYKIYKNISEEEAGREISESKKYLELLLHKQIISFCYPAGRYNLAIKKLVKKYNFKYARTISEYCFAKSQDNLAVGTSLHAYRHITDFWNRAKFSKWNIKEFMNNSDWEVLAKKMFDNVLENGGIFHFWGHSWLIEEEKSWDKLERVFSYIGKRPNVKYLTNGQLVKQ